MSADHRTVAPESPTGPFVPVKSADRALEVLEVLAETGGRWSLGELADRLEIPKSSLHGVLRTMEHRGWIETDGSGREYGLGVRSLLVGAAYVEVDTQVLRTQGVLDQLADATGETVHLGRLDGQNIVYLAKRESLHPLRLFSAIGRRLPAHATALGKAILAEHDFEAVQVRVGETLQALTEHTLTSASALGEELARTRERGYAVDREENTHGIHCFAVALSTSTPPRDAISISVPTIRLSPERRETIVSSLLEAQRRVRSGL